MTNTRSRRNVRWIGILGIVMLAVLIVLLAKAPGLLGAAAGKSTAAKATAELMRMPHPDTKDMRVVQLGGKTVDGLLEALAARGSKVEVSETHDRGVTILHVKIDGIAVAPIVAGCAACEPIVYEYEPIVFEY